MGVKAKKETRVATIVLRSDGVVETRFKADAVIDAAGIRENIVERKVLCEDRPHALLTVVPDDARFTTTAMSPDLFPDAEERAKITAIALVAPPGIQGMMARLYFSCFPDVSVTRVFHDEHAAITWLEEFSSPSNN